MAEKDTASSNGCKGSGAIKHQKEGACQGVPSGSSGGSVEVKSTPSGAMIFLDGSFTGKVTDARFEALAPGKHVFELTFDYYDKNSPTLRLVAELEEGTAMVLHGNMSLAVRRSDEGDGEFEPIVIDDDKTPANETTAGFVAVAPENSGIAAAEHPQKAGPVHSTGKSRVGRFSAGMGLRGKASVVSRFFAAVVDSFLFSVATGMTMFAAMLFLTKINLREPSILMTLQSLLGMVLWFSRDYLFGAGQSPGKRLFGLKVYGPSGQPCTLRESCRRNLPLALGPITYVLYSILMSIDFSVTFLLGILQLMVYGVLFTEIILMIADSRGRRWGDRFADTVVAPASSEVLYLRLGKSPGRIEIGKGAE